MSGTGTAALAKVLPTANGNAPTPLGEVINPLPTTGDLILEMEMDCALSGTFHMTASLPTMCADFAAPVVRRVDTTRSIKSPVKTNVGDRPVIAIVIGTNGGLAEFQTIS